MERTCSDQLLGLPQKEYISVRVQNPTIHNTHEDGRYTTFEVILQTNSLSFTSKHSIVRRRYSDFTWLRKALARTTDVKPPSLPFGRLFGTFSESYLKERQAILTAFLEKVVRETLFLSNAALHLFLQTCLTKKEMDVLLKDVKRRGSMDSITRAIKRFGSRSPSIPANLCNVVSSPFDSNDSGMNESKSTPSFNYEHGSWIHKSNSWRRSYSPAESFGTHRFSDSSSNASYDSSVGFSGNNNSSSSKDGEWVIIETPPPSPRDISFDVTDSAFPPKDDVKSSDFTQVTWNLGDSCHHKLKSKGPSWNEFRMSKFMLSNSVSISDKSNLSPIPYFKPHSLESAINHFYTNHVDGSAHCKHCLKVKKTSDMRRASSDTNIRDLPLDEPNSNIFNRSTGDNESISTVSSPLRLITDVERSAPLVSLAPSTPVAAVKSLEEIEDSPHREQEESPEVKAEVTSDNLLEVESKEVHMEENTTPENQIYNLPVTEENEKSASASEPANHKSDSNKEDEKNASFEQNTMLLTANLDSVQLKKERRTSLPIVASKPTQSIFPSKSYPSLWSTAMKDKSLSTTANGHGASLAGSVDSGMGSTSSSNSYVIRNGKVVVEKEPAVLETAVSGADKSNL
ncbi:unnamed protein product [Clavelina lepadiformis]|uniref:PX domain-containing protein n=1 Tax=Clavelina lepadiformis TaxID=159417 RepID=A0ABP0H366_CLALP